MSEHAVISLPPHRNAEVPLRNLQAASVRSRSLSSLPADRFLLRVRNSSCWLSRFRHSAPLDHRSLLLSGLRDMDSRRISLPPLRFARPFSAGQRCHPAVYPLAARFSPLGLYHMRPFDGRHISGELKDILPLFFVAAPISLLFPVYSAPVVLAGVVQKLRQRRMAALRAALFEFQVPALSADKEISPVPPQLREGSTKGYGITTRFWDGVFDTRFPQSVRRSLSKN